MNNFTTFHTQSFHYTNKELSKIITKDKNDQLIDELLISCTTKDERGTCLQEVRISTTTDRKEELHLIPVYD